MLWNEMACGRDVRALIEDKLDGSECLRNEAHVLDAAMLCGAKRTK